jgi:hypothetical protein
MKSKVLTALAIVALLQGCLYAGTGSTLGVPLIGQEKSNWCWNASSNMILEFYGFTPNQPDVADWAVEGWNVGNHLSATTVGPLATPDKPSSGTYNRKGCGLVLTKFGPIDSTFLDRCLTMDEVKSEIDNKQPAMLAVRWLSKGKDAGGHAIVLCGYSGDSTIVLHDPWPADSNVFAGCDGVAYIVDYSAMFDPNGPPYYDLAKTKGSALIGNRWAQTLQTRQNLDVCFLIDTTGSMGDDIDAVKTASLTMIDNLLKNHPNHRVAVVDYRDNPACVSCYDPCYPDESSMDYITNLDTAFTNDANVAKAAIDGLDLGYGGDLPEAVFSALIRTMSGSEIGAWRNDAERHIILMGDAPGHDPEPWLGGYSYDDVLAAWAADPNKIFIDTLLTGYGVSEDDATSQYGGLAAGTGGVMRTTASTDAGSAMEDMVYEIIEQPRFPDGNVAAFKPVFTFVPPTESMGPPVKNILLELQNWKVNKDPNRSAWKNYKKVTLPAAATSWTPTITLPRGDYRWRLGYIRGSGTFLLPDASSSRIAGATLMEPNLTEFTRVLVTPGDPTQYSPSDDFSAYAKDIHYGFYTGANATSYALEIWHYDIKKSCWKVWKKLTVKPPTKNPSATYLDVKVTGHIIDASKGSHYQWRVQSLNYDRTKIDPNAWVGLP